MKMLPTEYSVLSKLIAGIYNPLKREEYRQAGLSDTRYYMDHLWTIPHIPRQEWFDTFGIYNYLDDTHILTAVRDIVKQLDKKGYQL